MDDDCTSDITAFIASYVFARKQEIAKRQGLTEQDKEMISRGFSKLTDMQTTFDTVSQYNRTHPYADPRCAKDYKPATRHSTLLPASAPSKGTKNNVPANHRISAANEHIANSLWTL